MSIRPRRALLPRALCLVTFVATAAGAAFAPGDNVRELQFGGLPRAYSVHVPPGGVGTAPVPLVVDIHGFTSNRQQQQAISGMRAVADANGFLVAYPDGIRNAWNAGVCCGNPEIDDVGFFRALVDAIAAEAQVDRRRVYATGLSNGGAMSQRLACDAADLFAAAAPMAFPIPFRPLSGCQPARAIPVLTVMGLTDELVRYDGGAFGSAPDTFAYWRDVNACTGEAERVEQGQSRCETYTTCANETRVGLCSVTAQAFPGTFFSGHILYLNPDFVLAEVAWDFLSQFTLPDDVATPVEGTLAGRGELKGGLGRGAPPLPVRWEIRLGQGTWGASDDAGTVFSGSWRRRKGAKRTFLLELTTDARTALHGVVQAQIASLSGGPDFTLEPAGPVRVGVDRAGAPTSLRGRWRLLRSGVPGAVIGRYELQLRRPK